MLSDSSDSSIFIHLLPRSISVPCSQIHPSSSQIQLTATHALLFRVFSAISLLSTLMELSLDPCLQAGTVWQLMVRVILPPRNSAKRGYQTTGECHTSVSNAWDAKAPAEGVCCVDQRATDQAIKVQTPISLYAGRFRRERLHRYDFERSDIAERGREH